MFRLYFWGENKSGTIFKMTILFDVLPSQKSVLYPKCIHVVDTTLVCILLGQHSSFPVAFQILINLPLLVIHLITGNEWIVINFLLLKEENMIFPCFFLDCLMFLWLLMVDDYYLW